LRKATGGKGVPKGFQTQEETGKKDRTSQAIRNYEIYHQMDQGTATLDEVKDSSAGIKGWANWKRNIDGET